MKRKYINKHFRAGSLEIIRKTNALIEKYKEDGMDLTLRQLYYQFVGHDLFPEDRCWTMSNGRWVKDPDGTKNAEPNYTWLGDIVSNGRLAGLIDWDAIQDRTRFLRGNNHWNNPGEIIQEAWQKYKLDKWEGQTHYIEVWIEKEALIGVISSICHELDVDFFACKGYVSQSEMWRAGQRLKYYQREERECIIIHLGDHDPSGMDMTRDIQDRQNIFHCDEYLFPRIERIALNMDQIEKYNPPPNPAKLSDVRAKDYIAEHGKYSWELDALDPLVLRDLIEGAVLKYRDEDLYHEVLKTEEKHKRILKNVSRNWKSLE